MSFTLSESALKVASAPLLLGVFLIPLVGLAGPLKGWRDQKALHAQEFHEESLRLLRAREQAAVEHERQIREEDARIRREREEQTWKRYVVAQGIYDKCLGERMHLESRADFLHTQCTRNQSEANKCSGQKAERRGVGAAVGAGLGVALCVSNPVGWVTCGGAAALGAVGGMAAGAGTSQACPTVECPSDPRVWLGEALREAGVTSLPVCVPPERPVFQ